MGQWKFFVPLAHSALKAEHESLTGRYAVLAVAKGSHAAWAGTAAGGTHNTGTRERARTAKTVPCLPGVALVRLTPATNMLG